MPLTDKQLKEIRNHLDQAQNPLFFFDNDPDGLCSFLILRKAFDKGKGVPVRSFPDLNATYFRKVHELGADYIFILDKPIVSKSFFDEAEKYNIPIVWIDHHEIQVEIPSFVYYFNPINNKNPTTEPVTVLCYYIANKKDLQWIGIVGGVADRFTPDFYKNFSKEYPDLSIKSEDPFDIFYNSQIGKIARIFSFALKDKTTNVINMLKFLSNAKSPYDVLEETMKNNSMHSRFKQINSKYASLLMKAEGDYKRSEKLLFFQYGGDLSISSDLSNELSYRHPEKIVVVVYVTGIKANISMRGEKIRDKVLEIIKDFEGANGGGHENAIGLQVRVDDLEIFRNKLELVF